MTKKVWLTGASNVLDWFEKTATTPFFSVFNGKDLLFSNSVDDMDKAKDRLCSNIEMGEEAENDQTLQLRLYNAPGKDGYITEKTPYSNSVFFACVGKLNALAGFDRPNYNMKTDRILEEIKTMKEGLIQKVDNIEQRLVDLENGGVVQEEKKSFLAGMLEHPAIQGLIIKKVAGFLGVDEGAALPAMAGMAGIATDNNADENERLQNVYKRLKALEPGIVGVLEKIATVGEGDKAQFSQFIMLLKNM